MKLFQRTLWSFAGVIALQAALSGAALSTILGTMQAEDAARKLSSESANAFESFNAWKLALWKDINELAEDPGLAKAVAAAAGSPALDASVAQGIFLGQASSTVAAIVVRDDSRGLARYLDPGTSGLGLPPATSFSFKKTHPYVEILSSGGSLWFVGSVRIAANLDIFLVKKIDADLIGHLSYDPMVTVAVALPGGGPSAAGRYPGDAAAGKQALSFAMELLGAGSRAEGGAYIRYPRTEWRGGAYSAVLRRTGSIATPGGERPVLLAAVLSLAEYAARAARLQRAVLAISSIVVAITIVIALLLSRSIVSPIRLLSKATHRIAEGDYRARVRGPESGEIGELLDSFNGMAKKLAADKLELEEYIQEIVGLKERSDGIVESIREGLAVIDAEGRIESSNASFRRLFGEDSGREGARLVDIERGPFDGALVDAAREAMRTRESRGEATRRAADGRSFEIKLYPILASTRPEGARCVVIVEDASDRLAYEERVIQADKLASIGMLSAGVAHEINNPLSSILANVGNAISESSDPETIASLRIVEGETLRIARIVRQLLDFSAPRRSQGYSGGLEPRCDAPAVLRDLVRLVGYPFRGSGRVEFRVLADPGCPEAAITEDELKQVLLNLLKNALGAVGEEGIIRAEASASAGGVEIRVADSGPGIPEEAMARIFDPFFTTKQASGGEGGSGIGLGLSVAYGIVTKRGGSIRAANAEGGGAVFLVALPAAGGREGA